MRAAGGGHGRAVLLLETGEESGSPDLPAYLEHLAGRLGEVTLVVCLDADGGDYERLWLTSSLRGMLNVTVTVRVLAVGQHSGLASGIVPGFVPHHAVPAGPGGRIPGPARSGSPR